MTTTNKIIYFTLPTSFMAFIIIGLITCTIQTPKINNENQPTCLASITNDKMMAFPNGLEGRTDPSAYMAELSQTRKDAIGLATSLDTDYGNYLDDNERKELQECENGISNAMTFADADYWRSRYDQIKENQQREKQEYEDTQSTKTYTADIKPTPSAWTIITPTDTAPDSGIRDESLSTTSWGNNIEYLTRMEQLATKYDSPTNWFITTDYDLCRVVVLHRESDGWKPVKAYNANLSPRRWTGLHDIAHKQICNWADEYFTGDMVWPCNDWSSCFIEAYSDTNDGGHLRYIEGKGYEDCASIHSFSGDSTGYDNSGCTGLKAVNAKWIWDNVDCGTTLYFF